LPAREHGDDPRGDHRDVANAGGFSLHAGIDIEPHQRPKLECLCRYVSRSPIAEQRLAMTSAGQVRDQLKTPYRDGTTHIVLEPLALMARLAALVTPAHRGMGSKGQRVDQAGKPNKPITPRPVAMLWARRLTRVCGIEIEACARCGGKLKIIADIEEPAVIAKILSHLEGGDSDQERCELPLGARAPPVQARLL